MTGSIAHSLDFQSVTIDIIMNLKHEEKAVSVCMVKKRGCGFTYYRFFYKILAVSS